MAYVMPCITGKMGTTDFYEVTMSARELVSAVRPASEMDVWSTWSVDERLQRELNMKRINEQIVPYLQKSPDRFFGSIVVVAYETQTFEFGPVDPSVEEKKRRKCKLTMEVNFDAGARSLTSLAQSLEPKERRLADQAQAVGKYYQMAAQRLRDNGDGTVDRHKDWSDLAEDSELLRRV